MPMLTEGAHWAGFLGAEANGKLSRDNITVAQSQTILPGQVLGKVTASGQYVVLAPAAADGSQTAAAIALYNATTGSGVTAWIAAVTRTCEVNGLEVVWPAGITTNQKTAAITQLAALGIIVR